MSKYRKGRLLVLAGMLAFSTATVLAGSAGADKGTIKINGVVDDSTAQSNANHPHIDECVTVDTRGYSASGPMSLMVSLQPPSGKVDLFPAPVVVTQNDLTNASLWPQISAATGDTVADPNGYHIKITVFENGKGKSKVFWITNPDHCAVPLPPAIPT